MYWLQNNVDCSLLKGLRESVEKSIGFKQVFFLKGVPLLVIFVSFRCAWGFSTWNDSWQKSILNVLIYQDVFLWLSTS